MNLYTGRNSDEVKKINNAIAEAVKIKLHIEGKNLELKDISNMIKEDLDIPTKDFNAVVNAIYKDDVEEQLQKIELLKDDVEFYKGI